MTDLAVPPSTGPRFLSDVYEAASRCNKCSLCQAVCPTYVVNPVEWETARGRVGLVRDAIEGRIDLHEIVDGPLSTCLTCDNCVAACAPRVPTALIVSRARQELHEQEGHPAGSTFLLRGFLGRPSGVRWLHRLSRAAQVTGLHLAARKLGFTRWMGPMGQMAEQVGPLPRRRARQRLGELPEVAAPLRGTVAMVGCCYQDMADPDAALAVQRVLRANGYDTRNPDLGCVGLPAKTLGDRGAMQDMAAGTVTELMRHDVDGFVGDTASCTGHVQGFAVTLEDDERLAADAASVARRTELAGAFLDRVGMTATMAPLRWKVAIDEPCSLPIDGPTRTAAQRLLLQVPGLELVPLNEAAMCCGGPGTYAQQQPERSEAILERKFANVRASGCEVLVTENISCLIQLRKGARQYAPEVRVLHLMEVLDEAIDLARRRRPLRQR